MPFKYEYPRPSLTVDCLIFRNLPNPEILLIKRANTPFKNHWALPGGFVDENEILANAAKRELLEETGLGNIVLSQLHTFGDPGRDPRGHTVSVVFWGIAEKDAATFAGDDASQANWYPIHKLPELAFDHKIIIEFAIENLKELHL